MQAKWENARFIHLPAHGSRVSQFESCSIVQRKALTPNDLDSLAERLLRFAEHYRQIGRPSETELTEMCTSLSTPPTAVI